MPAKNATRLSSLLGTWTIWADTKASIGNYQVLAYFVVHFMPDPMADYSCQLPNCPERDNRICQRQGIDAGSHRRKEDFTCQNIQDIQSDWSDVAAFYYIGFHVHAGIPFRVEKVMDTGGWIGPYNLVLAQDIDDSTPSNVHAHETDLNTIHKFEERPSIGWKRRQRKQKEGISSVNEHLDATTVDRYRVRYVQTYSTPSLTRHKPVNNTLFLDWDAVMGTTAVNTTRHRQADLRHGDNAYERYQGSCDHGNLEPILPLYGFEFRNKNNNNNNNNSEEEVVVEVDYQLLVAPKTHNTAYNWMPWIQKRIHNQKDRLGFSIDGPFCYGDDPKRAYTVSISMNSGDSNAPSSGLKIERGCVEGLPCLPPAALGPNANNSASSSSMIHPSCPTVVDMSKLLYQVGFWCLLLVWIVTVCCSMCRTKRKERNVDPEENFPSEDAVEVLEEERGLLQPSESIEQDEFVDCLDGETSGSVPVDGKNRQEDATETPTESVV